MIQCDRCEESYSKYEGVRFWSGHWAERTSEGWKEYDTLCNDCHRALVREN